MTYEISKQYTIRHTQDDWEHYELKLILEEVSKLPKTTDTCYTPPDVLDLVEERLFNYFNYE
jgi:hypothetical protein